MIARSLAPALLLFALGCSGEEFSSTGSGGAAGAGGTSATGGAGGTSATGGASGASCRDLQKNGTTQTGVYTLLTQNGVALPAHCEMDVAGGGWTLIARSADENLQGNGFGQELRERLALHRRATVRVQRELSRLDAFLLAGPRDEVFRECRALAVGEQQRIGCLMIVGTEGVDKPGAGATVLALPMRLVLLAVLIAMLTASGDAGAIEQSRSGLDCLPAR